MPSSPAEPQPAVLNTNVLNALREAVVAMLAALAALACSLKLAASPGAAVLAVVLSLSLSRSQLDRDWRHRLESAVLLPVVGAATVGVGLLLQHLPWLGATIFVAGMSVSIWLRRFGTTARRIGSLIALPFVTLLVTPHLAVVDAGPIPAWLLPVLIALLALFWVSVLHVSAQRLGFLPPRASTSTPNQAGPLQASKLRPIASTRMAIQMAVALGLSFLIGHLLFGHHWAWIVLTAFIVMSRNRGRLDVVYKSIQRIGGAAAGTLLALLFSVYVGGHDADTAGMMLIAVFLGVWLRPINYAWWALFVTVALALLQGFENLPPSHILLLRLTEIVVGALIGVTTAWWVLPVRSSGVLRRRLADALQALGDALAPDATPQSTCRFLHAIDNLEHLAPAFRFARRIGQPRGADWIDAIKACRDPAIGLIERGESSTHVRRAVGAARKALLEPAELSASLKNLQLALTLDASSASSTCAD